MNGIISSLLCCSVDTKDDADDKLHNQQNKPSKESSSKNGNRNNISTPPRRDSVAKDIPSSESAGTSNNHAPEIEEINASGSNPSQNASNVQKKDLLDDASINETDTITNTNDDSNNNTPSSNIHHDDINAPLSGAQESQILTQVTSSGNRNTASNNVETDEDHDDDIYEEDSVGEESFLDLTKLQDGQAFNPETGFLLGAKDKKFGNKKCLILDLDETLVHSSFKYLRTADFVIPVEIDNQVHHVYVIKRPGVDEFLKKVGQWFEVVVFTASVSKYGDPLLDKLDFHKAVHHRLFRDSCYNYQGNFIKNLSQIGRPLADSIIIDNSPASYIFHPQHSIPISSWFSDTHDNELIDLLPFLEDISKSNVDDVGLVLDITL
ncbi:uncharacterized protein RJT20DRAFT_135825 [Scheffersomyces xylosifermentans]|uniref:uncharacterized protein n=1 Tax=Scheffersomyces xylosifermentans TaxID=1304137 RepID=UPI00315D620E